MSTLFLAWQNPGQSRKWYPIGRLDADSAYGPFRFRYIRGAEKASQESGFAPLLSFPDFRQVYESKDLFPLFKNRILSPEREDFEEYLRYLDLQVAEPDPLLILALTEGRRQTDTLEVFPKIARNADGGFRCRFFLHGWRHVSDAAKRRIEQLQPEDELRVTIELNNPATGLAVQLQTDDYHMIGWTPRYLVLDLVKIIGAEYRETRAKVVKVNPAPAPSQQRVLAELKGNWPNNMEPMSSEEFQDFA